MTKVTDALLAAFDMAKKSDFAAAVSSLEPQFERHVAVAKHFIPEGSSNLFDAELQFARGRTFGSADACFAAFAAAFDAEGRDSFLRRTAFVAASCRKF